MTLPDAACFLPGAMGAGETDAVLLIEDDDDTRERVAKEQRQRGAVRVPAADTAEAGAMLESAPRLAMILLDLSLPAAGSGDFLTRLRRRDHRNTPVLLCPGLPEHLKSADDLRRADYVNNLLSAVERLLPMRTL